MLLDTELLLEALLMRMLLSIISCGARPNRLQTRGTHRPEFASTIETKGKSWKVHGKVLGKDTMHTY